MLANQRREKILELLKEDGSAKVVDLARLFKVTEVTIRQDLDKMEKESNETIENAREARSAISDGIDSGSLRDDYADILFSDDPSDA